VPVDFSTALHIVPGDSAAATFRQTFPELRARMIVHRDMLATGPCPLADDERWITIRSAYWQDQIDDLRPLFEIVDHIARIGAAPAVILWLGVSVADQLLLGFVVHSLKAGGCSAANLHTIQFAGGPGFPVLSIGELPGDVLRNKAPRPSIIDTAALDQAFAFWRAYSSTNPADLAQFATTALAGHVQRAAHAILQRYPRQSDGLGSWAELLLRNVEARGPRAVSVIGYTMGEIEKLDWLGDLELFERLLSLAKGRSPLIEIQGNRTDMRDCTVSLTAAGISVLQGQRNAIELNGIDEWIGGVHLTKDAVTYREQLVFL
jgi:hypothetical protein